MTSAGVFRRVWRCCGFQSHRFVRRGSRPISAPSRGMVSYTSPPSCLENTSPLSLSCLPSNSLRGRCKSGDIPSRACTWWMSTFFTFRCTFHLRTSTLESVSKRNLLNCKRTFASMAIRPAPESVAREAASSIHQPRDPNTLSNYNAWRTKHTTADFAIDFDAKRLSGTVHLTLQKLAKDSKQITLDTR